MAIITLSRGTYSGGKAIAEKLAKRLGYPCLSREILIKKAAALFHMDESQLNDAMEETPGILRGDIPVCANNVNYVRNALLQEIKSLDIVYHGLAGDLLLQGVKKVLRIRIIASQEYRIKAAMENHNISHKEAANLILSLDRKRDRWAQVVLGKNWNDTSLYDIALNLDTIGLDSAVESIAHIARFEEYTADAETVQSLEDLLISSNIWMAITRNKSTSTIPVHIAVDKGQVRISGDVNSRKISDAIIDIARNTKGVSMVSNELQVGNKWLW